MQRTRLVWGRCAAVRCGTQSQISLFRDLYGGRNFLREPVQHLECQERGKLPEHTERAVGATRNLWRRAGMGGHGGSSQPITGLSGAKPEPPLVSHPWAY